MTNQEFEFEDEHQGNEIDTIPTYLVVSTSENSFENQQLKMEQLFGFCLLPEFDRNKEAPAMKYRHVHKSFLDQNVIITFY